MHAQAIIEDFWHHPHRRVTGSALKGSHDIAICDGIFRDLNDD